jgi:hypothetical protein
MDPRLCRIETSSIGDGGAMKSKTILAAVAFLISVGAAHAQSTLTKFYVRFTYDDGTAVSGGLQIFQGVAPNGTNILGMTLDSTGRVQGSLPLDPTQQYYGALTFTDPTGKQTSLSYAELPVCTATCAGPVLAALPNNEVDVTIAKATDMVAGVTLGPIPAPTPASSSAINLPNFKFANCVSTPAYGTAPSPSLYTTYDTGGGKAVGYIISGEKFDCTMTLSAAGTYNLSVRAESPYSGNGVHFEYPAGAKVGTEAIINQTIPSWGVSSENFANFSAGTAVLPAGQVTIRLVVDAPSNSLNLNWLN